jgi:predicted nuclease of predicted toxin-antitoxin system
VKLKLDENIGQRGLELLQRSGHDVMTVRDQNLLGSADAKLWAVCAAEGRVLITLDRDFGQVLRFPPEKSAGVVILEMGPRARTQSMLDRLSDFLCLAETRSVTGALWIVEPGRVRIHLRD